jgi:anthranilate synthase component I
MRSSWEEFAQRAKSADVAGYFERGGGRGPGSGTSVYFTRADELSTLEPRTDLGEFARAADHFLAGGRDRAIVGYAGFDAVGLFEPALRTFPPGSPFPLGEFAFVRAVRSRAVPPPRLAPRSQAPSGRAPLRPLADSLPRRRFEQSVRRLRRDIRDGEAYQVVLAHRRAWARPDDLLARAGRLRATERFAFFYYLRFGDREIVGVAPEAVVQIHGRRAIVDPIAGTYWKGRTSVRRPRLEVDPKELSEHRMLVDLARNDLGSVARAGSVRLLWRERTVRYARLVHLVSRVGAELREEVDPWRALGATFPAGTVSGAPKIRATELLRREEASWRGPYGGAVGLLQPNARSDWALAIRTAYAARNRLYTGAGAGIVYRSRPAQEFEETLVKLAHVESALVGGPA